MITNTFATPELAWAEKNTTSEEQRLKEACQGFEAIFFHQMLKSMRKATMDGGFIKKSNAEKIFTDMLDQEYADTLARNMSGGLADMLFEQLKASLIGTESAGQGAERGGLNAYKTDEKVNNIVDMEG